MSGIPVGETPTNGNTPAELKLRSAAALIRQIQKISPGLDESRLLLQELADVIDATSPLTDGDLASLGVTAAQVNALADFLTKLLAFMDASTQTRKSYRTTINAVKRVGAQV